MHDTIVEPFAGAAGYAVRHNHRNVVLCDKDPIIFGVWTYLINATASEIMHLPDLEDGQRVDDLDVCQEARWLIGFLVNTGSASPCKTQSNWMKEFVGTGQFWGEKRRIRIASQLGSTRHWDVRNCSYHDIDIGEATWFVDPPYIDKGKYYKHGSSGIDYSHLGEWCRSRNGQTIVCENEGATWLPFVNHNLSKSTSRTSGKTHSSEVIWTSGCDDKQIEMF